MYSVLVILAVIAAVLLTLIVLIQESKGGGLASNFAASNQIMGVRKTTDVVEKATWTLAAALVVFSVATIFFAPRGVESTSVATSTPLDISTPLTPTATTTEVPGSATEAVPVSNAATAE